VIPQLINLKSVSSMQGLSLSGLFSLAAVKSYICDGVGATMTFSKGSSVIKYLMMPR
jgi:hypothetical protein